MIFGIGTDIVRVSRVADGLNRFGERFARRIATEQELAEWRGHPRPAHYLAKRFAAKEAAAKALGTGFRDGLSLRHIGVVPDPLGKPTLAFYGRGADLIKEMGIGEAFVSLSDEDDYAVAYVVLTRGG